MNVSRTRRTRMVADERRDPDGAASWAVWWRNGHLHRERAHNRVLRALRSRREKRRDRRGRDRGYE